MDAASGPQDRAGKDRLAAGDHRAAHLRPSDASIGEDLADGTDHVSKPSTQLLKHHGTYQQDDRDQRVERAKQKLDKAWSFMVRSKMPGGRLTAEQFLDSIQVAMKQELDGKKRAYLDKGTTALTLALGTSSQVANAQGTGFM